MFDAIGDFLANSGPLVMVIVVLALAVLAFLVVSRIMRLWQKVPPNEILVVYGRGGTKVITGGGGFVLPVLEESQTMDRGVMNVAAQGDRMPTKNNVVVVVDWTAQIQVGDSEEMIKTYAGAFLGKSPAQVVELIRGTVAGSVRAVIATLTPEQARGDREEFARSVNDICADDLARMGLTVKSLNIVEVEDPDDGEEGYYSQLQARETARVRQEARVAQANADREAREREAEAQLAARNAEIVAQQAEAELQRNLDLKKAEFDRATNAARAEASMAGQMREAELARELRESEGASQLAAEQAATAVAEQAAARRRNELQAEVVATAEAEAQRTVALAEAEQAAAAARAEAVRQANQADADGILARAMAEANGQRALGEALSAFDDQALRQRIGLAFIEALPGLAEAQANAMAGIGEVRILDTGSGDGSAMQRFTRQLPTSLLELMEMARIAGIDFPGMMSNLTTGTPAAEDGSKAQKGAEA